MKLGIGSDHGGFNLKQSIIEHFENSEIEFVDYGTDSTDSCDYPLFAKDVCRAYLEGKIDYGILICTTGIGMSMTANKFKGIRAALVTNSDACSLTRRHNNANFLCIGAKYTSLDEAINYINIFVSTSFEGGRHERRVNMIENND